MDIKEVKVRVDDSSRYSVTIVLPGQQGRIGLLTYDLLRPDLGRSIVLLSADVMRGQLSDDQKKALQTLSGFINDSHKLNAYGRMAQAKSLVRQIAAGEINYQGKAIVVHRFGPVPALAIDTNQTIKLPNGDEVKLRLGLYLGSDKDSVKLPEGSPSTVHFLESLKVETATLFNRYFEDVGEMLWAIQHKADLAKALRWGKHVEAVLAESVKSKLVVLLPQNRGTRGGKKRQLQRELSESVRTDHATVILQAQYARLLALYLLNDLYELLGIRSEKKRYQERLNAFEANNKRWFLSNVIEDAKKGDVVLHDLVAIREHFEGSIVNGDQLPPDLLFLSTFHWVKQLAGFARFLAILRKHGAFEPVQKGQILDPRFGKIFFSSVHLVPSGVLVFQKVKATVPETRRNIIILAVQEPPDVRFKDVIQARLWLSDALLAVLPRLPQRLDGSSGGYGWIGKESALALLTGTDVSFALEKGVDRKQVEAEFSEIESDLFPWADQKSVANQLKEHFNSVVHVEYEVSDPNRPLDDRLKAHLSSLVEKSVRDRTDKLVNGFLDQFPPELIVHAEILQNARDGVQATYMAHFLKNANRVKFAPEDDEATRKEKALAKFRRLFEVANARAVIINEREYPLMVSEWENKKKKRYKVYFWQLRSILHELRPWCSTDEIVGWEKGLLARAIQRAQETLRKKALASAA